MPRLGRDLTFRGSTMPLGDATWALVRSYEHLYTGLGLRRDHIDSDRFCEPKRGSRKPALRPVQNFRA